MPLEDSEVNMEVIRSSSISWKTLDFVCVFFFFIFNISLKQFLS